MYYSVVSLICLATYNVYIDTEEKEDGDICTAHMGLQYVRVSFHTYGMNQTGSPVKKGVMLF